MRTIFRAATMAALCLFANISGATADGWGDNTAYRSNGWSSPTASVRSGLLREDAAPTRAATSQRRSLSAGVASDEDRPQRRTRGTRTASLGAGSIGTGGGTTGMASFYWQPQRVASGGWFNPNALTAAHKTLPFGTRVRVRNLANGQEVAVRINDRGPHVRGRVIDLSRAAAQQIGLLQMGVATIVVLRD